MHRASQVTLKDPTCQCRRHKETWVQHLDREDPGGHSNTLSILAWRIPWREELWPGGLQSTESQRVENNWSDLAQWAHTHNVFFNKFLLTIPFRNTKKSCARRSTAPVSWQTLFLPSWETTWSKHCKGEINETEKGKVTSPGSHARAVAKLWDALAPLSSIILLPAGPPLRKLARPLHSSDNTIQPCDRINDY